MDQETINQAYAFGMKFKEEDHSQLEVSDELMMAGFPTELSNQVAKDVIIERSKVKKTSRKRIQRYGWLLFGLGAVAQIVSFIYLNQIQLKLFGTFMIPGVIMIIYGTVSK